MGGWGPISRNQDQEVLIQNLAVIEERCGLSISGGGSEIGPNAVAHLVKTAPHARSSLTNDDTQVNAHPTDGLRARGGFGGPVCWIHTMD